MGKGLFLPKISTRFPCTKENLVGRWDRETVLLCADWGI